MATKKKAIKAVAKKATPAKAAPKKASKKKAVAPAKPAPKKKIVAKAQVGPTTNKASALSKIADLEAQVDGLKRDAVGELKEQLAMARKAVQTLEHELASLTGGSTGTKRRKRG